MIKAVNKQANKEERKEQAKSKLATERRASKRKEQGERGLDYIASSPSQQARQIGERGEREARERERERRKDKEEEEENYVCLLVCHFGRRFGR